MEWKIIVLPPVSIALGTCGLSRAGLLRVLTTIHTNLRHEADQYRSDRHPEEPDCFVYPVGLADGGRWHRLFLLVNDTTATGHLFVEGLIHEISPEENGE